MKLKNLPTPASCGQGLKACATMPGSTARFIHWEAEAQKIEVLCPGSQAHAWKHRALLKAWFYNPEAPSEKPGPDTSTAQAFLPQLRSTFLCPLRILFSCLRYSVARLGWLKCLSQLEHWLWESISQFNRKFMQSCHPAQQFYTQVPVQDT